MEYPQELRYSKEHEWIRIEGSRATIGITDFAQDALGDVVFVQLPDLGLEVIVGASCAEVESTKSVSEVYAPLSGEIVGTNTRLDQEPELVNTAPYSDGWMVVIALDAPDEVSGLMTAAEYQAFCEAS
jgi:glycine cleavage system H protein